MKTAIAILNWNGRKLLEEFLPSVIENSEEADIYVIDNASDDDSVAYLRSNFPSVKIIQNEGNFGYAKGYNEGIKKIFRQAQYDAQQVNDDKNKISHAGQYDAQLVNDDKNKKSHAAQYDAQLVNDDKNKKSHAAQYDALQVNDGKNKISHAAQYDALQVNDDKNKISHAAQYDAQQVNDDKNKKSHAELVEASSSIPEILCLLNSDVKVAPNWISPVLNLFEKDKEIAAIQPKILDYKNPTHFEYAGAGGGFVDNFGYPYCRGRVFWTLEEDKGQYDDSIQTFWASGACMFIRRKDFEEIGGFDEGFFAHMEEIDLCWRLNNAGKKVFYCGESSVYHLGGGTLKNSNPKKTYLNFRNSLWMLVKNLPEWKAFPFVFARLSLDGITGIVFLFYEGFSHFWAVLDSHFGFYKRLFHYMKLRKPGKKNYYRSKLVPFQYFVMKRKNFSDLR